MQKRKGNWNMQITDVRVRKITKEGKMKAIVSITLDDEFVVHDIKVIEGEKGLFIAMPSKKATDGEYRDIAHPINSSTRENLQRVILESYEKALEEPEELLPPLLPQEVRPRAMVPAIASAMIFVILFMLFLLFFKKI